MCLHGECSTTESDPDKVVRHTLELELQSQQLAAAAAGSFSGGMLKDNVLGQLGCEFSLQLLMLASHSDCLRCKAKPLFRVIVLTPTAGPAHMSNSSV